MVDGKVEYQTGQETTTKDWRKLFATSVDQSLQYLSPQKVDAKVVVTLSAQIFEEWEKIWQNAMVTQFIEQVPNFSLFQKLVKIMWGFDAEVKPAGRNLFVIQFSDIEVRDRVLKERSWYVQNKPFIVRKWELRLTTLDLDLTRIPLWVHLSNIPLELFTKEGLSYIASTIGSPLYMDRITAA
ncbi:hypothetical protein DITRI_Ditri07aG0080200 [Diplodiscus trichospermus]